MTVQKPVRLEDLAGVWKRLVLIDGDGSQDRESEVYWIQGQTLCGDIRRHLRPTALLSREAVAALPCLDAFAGNLESVGGNFCWDAALRLRPYIGPPDEGRLRWLGEDLEETGVHLDYYERWTRLSPMRAGDTAVCLQDPDSGDRAYVLNIGRFAFFAYEAHQDRHTGADNAAEFSLFELAADQPHVVLSTVEATPTRVPRLEFCDARRQSAWLQRTDRPTQDPRVWRVAALEEYSEPLQVTQPISNRSRP